MELLKKVFKSTFFVIALFCIIGVVVAQAQFAFFGHPLKGKPAPDFTLDTLNGSQNLAQVRQGQKAILFFWATWCPHCREQLQELDSRKGEFKSKNIEIVLVDLAESEQLVRQYMKKENIRFNVFLDRNSTVTEQYGVYGVPTYFFVDEQGVVQTVEHFLPEDYEKFFKS